MANSQFLDILLIAMVAGVILFRLYTVLGRRTGHERPPENYRLSGNASAGAGDEAAKDANRIPARPALTERPSDPVASGLVDIQLADRSFDKEHFVTGARAAYEMIVTAFANDDRTTLRPLLGEEVYAAFDAAIQSRQQRGEKVSFTFVGFKDVKITAAALRGRMAEVTLTFEAQFISATTDAKGTLIDGDSKTVRDVTDIWTFSRDVRMRDPNWLLVATSGGQP
ncbi:MAG: Tim44 domain-containing protein [Alphaproteobacteria bacterium]|nr:39S ribosomal protein L45 [Alphaproteobacteria bacterium]MDE2109631.1 Tim44 domain-containing protein [Alphaproteobacteria bacterium]MDE2493051.1 Tim44 domain-containing protein [Alphaproteobacteria bacterium]